MKEKYTLGPVEFVGTLHDMVKDNPFQWRKVANLMYKFWIIRNPGLRSLSDWVLEMNAFFQSVEDTKLPNGVKIEILKVVASVFKEDTHFVSRVGTIENESEYSIPFIPWS